MATAGAHGSTGEVVLTGSSVGLPAPAEDVLGSAAPEEPAGPGRPRVEGGDRLAVRRLPLLLVRERWTARAAAAVLALASVVAVRGVPPVPVLVVASDGLDVVLSDGSREPVAVPAGQEPAALLRLDGATAVLLRPSGTAWLLLDGARSLRRLGSADRLVPDVRPDVVWLSQGTTDKRLSGFRSDGTLVEERAVVNEHDLLLVTDEGVLDDEVERPGGSTPTLRSADGTVLRRLAGPVQVLDVRGSSLLVLRGSCVTACTVEVVDATAAPAVRARLTAPRLTRLPAGLVVLQGSLSPDGRSAALAGRASEADQPTGDAGEAVLLRGVVGSQAWSRTVEGGCSLLSCKVAWHDGTVLATVDRDPGTLVSWGDDSPPEPWDVTLPGVVALAGL